MLSEHMLFLTYTPREDSELRGYIPWLRSTDTPFFNTVPGIQHYANWKLIEGGGSSKGNWGWFDFLHIEPGKGPEDIWENEKLAAFAKNWNVMWGRDPDNADLSVNYQIHEARRVQAPADTRTDFIALVLNPDRARLPKGAEIWQVTKAVLGDAVQGEFAVVNLPIGSQTADPAWGEAVLLAECLAKPDKYVTI